MNHASIERAWARHRKSPVRKSIVDHLRKMARATSNGTDEMILDIAADLIGGPVPDQAEIDEVATSIYQCFPAWRRAADAGESQAIAVVALYRKHALEYIRNEGRVC